jgi:acyl homoserine lactone synthase/acyl-homoserine lactone synthase
MFEARKRVFVDMLGWNIPVVGDRYEVDLFDDAFATYVILSGPDGGHRASARLLRTVRPHILGDLFPTLSEGPVPASDDIREITRFCIEPTLDRRERRQARNALVSALARHATTDEISSYTAVAEPNWFRQILDFGWRCSPLGKAQRVAGEELVALRIDIDEHTISQLAATGIYTDAPYRVIGSELELAA